MSNNAFINYMKAIQAKQTEGSTTVIERPMSIQSTEPVVQNAPVQVQDQWVSVPFTQTNGVGMYTLYIKDSMVDIVNVTNFRSSLYGAARLISTYSEVYNKEIRAYLTGYTDPNNFKVEASIIGIPITFIVYAENGLLNLVASYIR